MKYKLRSAVKNDSNIIKTLVRQARLNPFDLDWRRFIVATTPQEGVIGCGQIKRHRDGSRELASLVVDPEYRGDGIGKTILEQLLANHPTPVYLTCLSSLMEYYESFGFTVTTNNDLPPYFCRLKRLFNIFRIFSKSQEDLLIMSII